MSLRLSLVLVVIFAVASIAVAWRIRNAPEEERESLSPYFYTLDDTDITHVSIIAGGRKTRRRTSRPSPIRTWTIAGGQGRMASARLARSLPRSGSGGSFKLV